MADQEEMEAVAHAVADHVDKKIRMAFTAEEFGKMIGEIITRRLEPVLKRIEDAEHRAQKHAEHLQRLQGRVDGWKEARG